MTEDAEDEVVVEWDECLSITSKRQSGNAEHESALYIRRLNGRGVLEIDVCQSLVLPMSSNIEMSTTVNIPLAELPKLYEALSVDFSEMTPLKKLYDEKCGAYSTSSTRVL